MAMSSQLDPAMEMTRIISSPSTWPCSLRNIHPCLPLKPNKIILIKSSSRSSTLIQSQTITHKPKTRKSTTETFSLLYKKNPHVIYKEIQRLARDNNLNEAVSLLDYLQHLGIPVNATTFSSLIASCIRSKSFDQAKHVHAQIRANGLGRNEFLRIKVIQMYASCGCFQDAEQELIDLCSSSAGATSVYQWNALFRGIVVSGNRRFDDLILTYSTMRELGVDLNEYSFSCLIKGLAGAREFKEGLKAHGLLIKNGLIGSSILKTCLIDLYFKCRKPRLAHHLFDEMPESDIVAWGTMIAGLGHNGLRIEALEYLRLMIQQGIAPNSVGLTTILPIIGELSETKIGREIHAYLVKKPKYSEELFIQSALIDMYSKCGDLNSARRTFYGSKKRNHVSWTALISGYISNGRLKQSLRLLVWMQQEGFKPDVVTLATVLPVCASLKSELQGRAIHGYLLRNRIRLTVSLSTSLMVMYSKCGNLDYCRRLFYQMERRNVISWTVMIDSLMEIGFQDEALDLFRSMLRNGQKPDAVVISKVLGVCIESELLKNGKEIHGYVLKKRFQRVPFVCAQLSKMYRSCRENEKAETVLHYRGSNGHFEDVSSNQISSIQRKQNPQDPKVKKTNN